MILRIVFNCLWLAIGPVSAKITCQKAAEQFSERRLTCPTDPDSGSGASSFVYRVEENVGGSVVPYALKVVDFKDPDNSDSIDQLRTEIEVLGKVKDHSHVVKIIEHKETKDGLFILMEFIPGGSLHFLSITTSRPLKNPEFLIRLINGIAKGVKEIHRIGYVIRDLKPENIMLTEKLEPKLIDFGLAVKIGAEIPMIRGTKPYIDPRMWIWSSCEDPTDATEMTEHKFDTAIDVFSIGAIFRFLFSPIPRGLVNEDKDIDKKVFSDQYIIPKGTELNTAQVMQHCTLLEAAERPTVDKLIEMTESALKTADKKKYLTVNEIKITPLSKFSDAQFTASTIETESTAAKIRKEYSEIISDLSASDDIQNSQKKEEAKQKQSTKEKPGFFTRLFICGNKKSKISPQKKIRLLMKEPEVRALVDRINEQPVFSSKNKIQIAGVTALVILSLCWILIFRSCFRSKLEGSGDLQLCGLSLAASTQTPTTSKLAPEVRGQLLTLA